LKVIGEVHIDPDEWRAVNADRSWLKTEIVINGVSLHLDAAEVVRGGVQEGPGELAETVAAVHEAVGANGSWQTLRIAGREYVLIATPFC
jgi:hypothetical protein